MKVKHHYIVWKLLKLAVDGAFGSYSEASGGLLASLAYTPPQLQQKKNWKILEKFRFSEFFFRRNHLYDE